MTTWAVGDIQGCADELNTLLKKIDFNIDRDRLWLTGDLVNRGPASLEVLREVRAMGDNAICVLGNHDLHLLAVALCDAEQKNSKDTLDPILAAPDRDELLQWLLHRPLLHRDTELGYTLIHAGLPPQWDITEAEAAAGEMEQVLRGEGYLDYFSHMYGNRPKLWSDALGGQDRLRFITNCFTRLRYCSNEGELRLKDKGPPGSQKQGYHPWFTIPGRRSRDEPIIFGHWSTLHLVPAPAPEYNVVPLDTGCLWGGELVAFCLEDRRRVVLDCAGKARIEDHA